MSHAFFHTNVPLRDRTYYRMGGTAAHFALPRCIGEVRTSLLWAKERNLPIAVLGSGSNSVFADGDFEGLVLSLAELQFLTWETETLLYAEAGVTNTEISEVCLWAERTGAEWMYRMPGQLGATVRMNARCYGGEISQICREVVAIDHDGVLKTYEGKAVFRGYKNTSLMEKPEVILAVRLSLPQSGAPEEIHERMVTCENDRHSKHHFDLPSCGSTFKNNYAVGKPSGRIFDELGLKGERRGEAEVSQYHANFVWNRGLAKTSDMLSLAAHMREQAFQRSHALLELEVQPIGRFSLPEFTNCGMDALGPSDASVDGRWVGLLWHPERNQASTAFPRVLLQAPFLPYFQKSGVSLPEVHAQLVQLAPLTAAQGDPDAPFLQWSTHCAVKPESFFFLAPPQEGNRFRDKLWDFSVSEMFLANPGNPNSYIELEIAPSEHWVAIAFEAPRQRARTHETPQEVHWPGVRTFREDCSFGMTISYQQVAHLISQDKILVQFAASLGFERYFLAPHWSWMDPAFGQDAKADFHQPERFFPVRLF